MFYNYIKILIKIRNEKDFKLKLLVIKKLCVYYN